MRFSRFRSESATAPEIPQVTCWSNRRCLITSFSRTVWATSWREGFMQTLIRKNASIHVPLFKVLGSTSQELRSSTQNSLANARFTVLLTPTHLKGLHLPFTCPLGANQNLFKQVQHFSQTLQLTPNLLTIDPSLQGGYSSIVYTRPTILIRNRR